MDRKTAGKAMIAMHIVSLLLVIAVILAEWLRAIRGLQRALTILLGVCILVDVSLLAAYFRRSREMESDLTRSQVELLRQQLQSNEDKLNALQSQINPHFLYNTLETIREMALEHDDRELSRVISSLSLMFRYSMDFTNTVVPLEHELAQVQRYMKLQQFRFPDRFSLELIKECGEDDLHRVMIPKFTVQPLIENAVKHGFGNMREGCVLRIRMSSSTDTFRIAVEDNGRGVEPEILRVLNDGIKNGRRKGPEESAHNGIGLNNIYNRLRLYFGDSVDVYAYSSPGVGTIVTVEFPIKKNG